MCIYLGGSGIAFKTVPLKKYVRPIIAGLTKLTNEEVAKSYNMGLDEYEDRVRASKQALTHERKTKEWRTERALLNRIKYHMVDYLALERFTTEKLTNWLVEYPQGMIVGDEFSKTFKGVKNKEYLSDNMEDLSRLADCDLGKVGTISRGVEYPEHAYVSFVSASTYYMLTLMGDDFFIQGTGNRILWIVDEKREEVDIEKEVLLAKFFWNPEDEVSFRHLLDNLVGKLANIRKLPEGVVMLTFDASIELDRYRLQKYNEAVRISNINPLDKDGNLIARLAQSAMRLAGIHCIGRYAWEYDPEDPISKMEISKEDAQWAIAKAERHYNHYKRMYDLVPAIKRSLTKNYTNDHEQILYLLPKIDEEGNKTTFAQIMRKTGWKTKDTQEILEAMVVTGKLTMYNEIKAGKKKQLITLYKRGPEA